MKTSSQILKIFGRYNKLIGHGKEKRITDNIQVPGSAQRVVPFTEIETQLKKQLWREGNELSFTNV